MIQIEETREIKVKELAKYARFEWEKAGPLAQIVVAESEKVWALIDKRPILYVGVVRESLLATPRLWFFLCKGFRKRHLRAVRRAVAHLWEAFPRIDTYVEERWPEGCRFAEFMGFRRTKRTEGAYVVYEGRR